MRCRFYGSPKLGSMTLGDSSWARLYSIIAIRGRRRYSARVGFGLSALTPGGEFGTEMRIVDELIARDEVGGAEDLKGTDLFKDYYCSYSADGHGNVNDRPWHSERELLKRGCRRDESRYTSFPPRPAKQEKRHRLRTGRILTRAAPFHSLTGLAQQSRTRVRFSIVKCK